jgi:phosphoserine phosphatase RsbU/P
VDPAGQLFSDSRLHEVVARCGGQTPQQTVERVVESVKTFAAEAPQEDDITVLAVQFRP